MQHSPSQNHLTAQAIASDRMAEHGGLQGQRASWDVEYSGAAPLWKGPGQLEIEIISGSTVLDLGCGNGKNLAMLTRRGARIIALDFSGKALNACRRQLGGDDDVQFISGDAASLPLKDDSVDLVVACHVLEHLLSAERTMVAKEIDRVLSPGGRLHVRVFSVEDMRHGKGTRIEDETFLRGNGILYHHFNTNELISLFPTFMMNNIRDLKQTKRFDGKEYFRIELEGSFTKC